MTEKEIRDAIEDIQYNIKPSVGGKSLDLAVAALRLQIWNKIEDLDKDEKESKLLCRFSDGTIETFPTEAIADWNRISPIKVTHFQYVPDFTDEPCTGCKKNSQAFCPLMNGTGCFDYLKDQFGVDLRGDKP